MMRRVLPHCERVVRSNSRFGMVIQKERLGWAGNISYLMSQSKGEFWYFNQQDDLVTQDYIEVLLQHARDNPSAAVTYCDIQAFGKWNVKACQNSVRGVPWGAGSNPIDRWLRRCRISRTCAIRCTKTRR